MGRGRRGIRKDSSQSPIPYPPNPLSPSCVGGVFYLEAHTFDEN